MAPAVSPGRTVTCFESGEAADLGAAARGSGADALVAGERGAAAGRGPEGPGAGASRGIGEAVTDGGGKTGDTWAAELGASF